MIVQTFDGISADGTYGPLTSGLPLLTRYIKVILFVSTGKKSTSVFQVSFSCLIMFYKKTDNLYHNITPFVSFNLSFQGKRSFAPIVDRTWTMGAHKCSTVTFFIKLHAESKAVMISTQFQSH